MCPVCPGFARSLLARRSDVGGGAARPVLADWSRPANQADPVTVTQRDNREQAYRQPLRGPPKVHPRVYLYADLRVPCR